MKTLDPYLDSLLIPTLSIAAAYVLGCWNTGYYLVRWKSGQDIRQLGSGNAGAKNVGRVLGPAGFGVTLFGDAVKGILAVLLAQLAGGGSATIVLAAIAVTVGHNWPAQLGFRGGTGVACSFGALLVIDPMLALAMFGLFAAFLSITQSFTLSGLLAYASGPLLALLCGHNPLFALGSASLGAAVLLPHLIGLSRPQPAHE